MHDDAEDWLVMIVRPLCEIRIKALVRKEGSYKGVETKLKKWLVD